jgi:tRNA dimethylallyltransferase
MSETGKKFSELRTASESPYTFARIGIFPEWDVLRSNIEKRSQAMLDEGLISEVQKFREAYPDSPLLQTINYKEGGLLLDKKISEEEAITLMTQATMRYAHRQMSWWKRRNDIAWVCA